MLLLNLFLVSVFDHGLFDFGFEDHVMLMFICLSRYASGLMFIFMIIFSKEGYTMLRKLLWQKEMFQLIQ